MLGVGNAALDWFASCFVNQTQQVITGTDSSSVSELLIGTPQGSVLGSKCFVTYAEDVTEIFQQHGIPHHLFADDMQGTGRGKPSRVNKVATKLGICVSAVSNWCAVKSLQLNTKKTEVMWFGSATNLSSVDQHLQVGSDKVSLSTVVHDLGVFFDSELTMTSHISRITSECFYQFRRLRAVRGQLGQEVTGRLVLAFILSRLDYWN